MPSTRLQQAKKKISGGFNSWRKKHKERIAIDTSGADVLGATRSWTWRPLDFEPTVSDITQDPTWSWGQHSSNNVLAGVELGSCESPGRSQDSGYTPDDETSVCRRQNSESPPSSPPFLIPALGSLDGEQFVNKLFSDFLPVSDDSSEDERDVMNPTAGRDHSRSQTPERSESGGVPPGRGLARPPLDAGNEEAEFRDHSRIIESVGGGGDTPYERPRNESDDDEGMSSDDDTLMNFSISTDDDNDCAEESPKNSNGELTKQEVPSSEACDNDGQQSFVASMCPMPGVSRRTEVDVSVQSMMDSRQVWTPGPCPDGGSLPSSPALQNRPRQPAPTSAPLPRNSPEVVETRITNGEGCSSPARVKRVGDPSEVPGCAIPGREGIGDLVEKVLEDESMKVCHHPQCSEDNHDKPLLLCRQCDLDIHRQPEFSGHLVLDATSKRLSYCRQEQSPVESDSAEDWHHDEDTVDGLSLFVKKPSKDFKRNKSPSEVERKLKRKKAVKKKSFSKNDSFSAPALEAALAQIACPEGPDMMASVTSETEGEVADGVGGERKDSHTWDSLYFARLDGTDCSAPDSLPPSTPRTPVRRQSKVAIQDGFFTIKVCSEGDSEDLEVVPASQFTTLREVLEPILTRRTIDINFVNVFIEKSNTPLPLYSDSFFLVGNTLEIKEKDERELDMVSQGSGKQRPSSASKSSNKAAKSSGRSSRRDSVGVVATLLEPPPTKQRRGSLQLPFREHFFNSKGDNSQSKSGEVRSQDDPFGSLRGRRGTNLSIDDTYTIPSTSPQGTLTFSEGKKGKTQKLSVVSLFNTTSSKDREKHEQLHEILCGYSSNGLPPMPELLSLGRPKFDESLFQTEAHWSSVVDNASTLTKRQHDQQEAIWELLQTELSYINQIRVIIDVFQNCLLNIQQEALLNEIETERLFCNIDQVLICNCRLWQDSLINILEDARRNRHPLNPSLLKPAFLSEFKKLIGPYTKYCMEQKQCTEYMKSRHTENDLFKMFVLWAETQKQCNRLKLTDLLVKPVQRITKYSLLLQAILRKTEDDRQRRDLLEMIASVDECVISINSKMQYQLDMERLEAIMTKIEPYDCVEPPSEECVKIIQEYNSKFNLMTPMAGLQVPQTRSLLMHSNLRLKESQSKTDVDCFLFTDLILVCKSNKRMDKYKIFRPPMRLDQIVVSDLKDRGSFLLIYMNEYDVPVAAYTFHGDQTAVRLWLEKIRDAQAEYNERKMEDHRLHVSRLSRSREEAKNNSSPGTTPLNMKYHPVADLPSIPRSASMDSTEGQFLPNILPAKTSDGSLPSNGILSPQALERVSSCSEISSRGASRTHVLSQERHASSSPEYSPTNERKHKPVKASQSVPNIHGSQLMQAGTEDCYDEEGDNRGMTVDDMSVITSVGSLSLSPSCLMEQSSFDSDFNSCLNKPNQRRVSRSEKRYYTADSIQELRQEKDNSIHKRLSWQNENQLEERLRRKVLSSDSVHSMPSSSGVSSAGSLHLNPESDISEETESQKTGRSLSSVDSSLETDTNNSVANSDPESSRCRAKSSSDIAELISSLKTGEREDGISSVNLPVHGHAKRFSHSQLLIMKKHLLLDASVEASEV